MNPDSVHRVSDAAREWPERHPPEPDAEGMTRRGTSEGLGRPVESNAPDLPHLRALLWIVSVVFLGAGAVLARTDMGSPGFGFGLGAGMVLASLACLGFLSTGHLQAAPADPRAYSGDAAGASFASSFHPHSTGEAGSMGSEPAGEASQLGRDVVSAYRLFGLTPEASMREIRVRYHRLAHTHHPDKAVGLAHAVRRAAEERMKEINVAYEILQRHREG